MRSRVRADLELSRWAADTMFFLGIFLNQSQVLSGVNMSLADFFLIAAVVTISYQGRRVLPMPALTFFLVLSISTIFTAAYMTPEIYGVSAPVQSIVREWLKLLVLACYFFVGFNMSQQEGKVLFGSFSIAAISLGVVGITFSSLNISLLSEKMDTFSRFRGFMNDPNYFSLLLVCALPMLIRNPAVAGPLKWLGGIVIFIAITVTGSKTGMTSFVAYLAFVLIGHVVRSRESLTRLGRLMAEISVAIVLIVILAPQFGRLTESFSTISPGAKRISLLFTDFDRALTEEGSGRDIAWDTAFQIWRQSPFVGVGIGPYGQVADGIAGMPIIAHNSYLQLGVEWGTIGAAVFFLLIVRLLTVRLFGEAGLLRRVSQDITLILLTGSFAISLNNVRLLWIALGYLTFSYFHTPPHGDETYEPAPGGSHSGSLTSRRVGS